MEIAILCGRYLLTELGVLLAANVLSKKLPGYTKEDKRNKALLICSGVISALMLLITKDFMTGVRNAVFALLLSFGSISDVRERKVPDYVSAGILLTGLCALSAQQMVYHSAAGIAMFGLVFVLAMIHFGKFGGADVKIIGASSFLLGFPNCAFGTLLGLLSGIIVTPIVNRNITAENKKTMPLIPYLSFGFLSVTAINEILRLFGYNTNFII